MSKQIINDIYGYTVFALIDKRNSKIEGHRLILSDKQMSDIEDIITSEKVSVIEDVSFEVQND